jgi:hypothetical protein
MAAIDGLSYLSEFLSFGTYFGTWKMKMGDSKRFKRYSLKPKFWKNGV